MLLIILSASLWNIERVNQLALESDHEKERQQHEYKQGCVAVPRVNHAVPVQRLTDIYQVVMPEGEEVTQRLDRPVHGWLGKGETAN